MGKGGTIESFAPPPGVPRSKHMGTDVPVFIPTNPKMPWFTQGDIDSFFMLFFDNLSSLIAIVGAALSATFALDPSGVAALGPNTPPGAYPFNEIVDEYYNMIYRKMLPGAGIAICFGNFYYSWMARKLAYYDKRENVTAHPYGVNTPGGFLMVYNVVYVLVPKYYTTEWDKNSTVKDQTNKIWQSAVAANMVIGIISCAGAWFGPWVIRNVPLPGLLAPTQGVGFVYLGLDPFITFVASEAFVSWIPMYIAMAGYFATSEGGFVVKGVKIPAAALVIAWGVTAYWSNLCHYNKKTYYANNNKAIEQGTAVTIPYPQNRGCGSIQNHIEDLDTAKKRLWENKLSVGLGLSYWKDVPDFIGLVTPVSIQGIVETLEHWQMACLKGDSYNVREMMFADGLGTVIGSFFGSFLPNTVYLGHPIHKANGASCGYGMANSVVFLFVLMTGLLAVIQAIIPLEVMNVIIMCVGLCIVRNALEVTTSRNHPAMILGIWCVTADYIIKSGAGEISQGANGVPKRGWWNVGASGGIMNALIIVSSLSDLIDRKYLRGAAFLFVAIWFSMFGIMHGNNLQGHSIGADQRAGRGEATWAGESPAPTPPGNEGWRFAIAYSILCAGYICAHFLQQAGFTEPPHEEPSHTQMLSKAITAGIDESNEKEKDFDTEIKDLENDLEKDPENLENRAQNPGPSGY